MLIKLHYADDLLPVLVNTDFIIAVDSKDQGSLVLLKDLNGGIAVVESPEQLYSLCTKNLDL